MAARMKPNRRIDRGKKRRKRLLFVASLGGVALSGAILAQDLPARVQPPEAPASEEAPEIEPPAPPPGPRTLPATVTARSALEGFALREGELAEGLPADAFFVLESEEAIPDLRFRLFDEAHRLVPAEETIEIGRGTRYLLLPRSALKSGSRYTLIAEGQEGSQPTDVSGQRYLPAHFTLIVRDG